MKKYLIPIFAFVYLVGLAIDVFMFMSGAYSGPFEINWLSLHFYYGTLVAVLYVLSNSHIAIEYKISRFLSAILAIILVFILPLPILFFIKNFPAWF